MHKTAITLENLKKSLKNDLKSHIGISHDFSKEDIKEIIQRISSFSDFDRELKNVIMTSKMQLEEQRVETVAIMEEDKNRNDLGSTALYVSLIAIFLSFFTTIFNVVVENASETRSEGNLIYYEAIATMFICLFIFVALAYFYSFIASRKQVKNYKRISYFTVKLACIEKEQQEQVSGWRKVKYEIRLKEK